VAQALWLAHWINRALLSLKPAVQLPVEFESATRSARAGRGLTTLAADRLASSVYCRRCKLPNRNVVGALKDETYRERVRALALT
jgi:hypothetical protein